ncbi:MAG: T9SS type A sorting domain-containing protein [Vicingaceae bacterium]
MLGTTSLKTIAQKLFTSTAVFQNKNTLLRTSFLLLLGLALNQSTSAQWNQIGSDIDGEFSNNFFGNSVSMPSANILAVGITGSSGPASNPTGLFTGGLKVYEWLGNNWVQKGVSLYGVEGSNFFGSSVSMPNVNTVSVGAPGFNGNGFDVGMVQIYQWNGNSWIQEGDDILGEENGENFGSSVSMPNTNTLAIGAPDNDGNGFNSGRVAVYQWTGITWVQKGNDIEGEATGDRSGFSVSMPDANTVAIGAPNNNGNGNTSGHVRIYQWTGTTWVQKGSDIDGEAAGDGSGRSISMPDANTVVIGAPFNDGNGINSGHVRIYQWSGTTWLQRGSDIDSEATGDQSGTSVSMPDANTVAIGESQNGDNGFRSGQVRVFEWSSTNDWVQKGLDMNGEANVDEFGTSISMPDPNTVAIGAAGNDGNGSDAGHVRVFNYGSVSIGPEIRLSREFKLYPNPTKRNFTLEINPVGEEQELFIYNLQGKLVHQQSLLRAKEQINTEKWKAGVYFVRYGEQMEKLVILE